MTDDATVLTPEDRAILALTATYDENVARGVTFLDATFPEWRATMSKHLKAFEISSTKACVIGTLARFDMAQFRTEIRRQLRYRGVERAYEVGLQTLVQTPNGPPTTLETADWASEHGFNIGSLTERDVLEYDVYIDTHRQYALLQEAWMRVLAPQESD